MLTVAVKLGDLSRTLALGAAVFAGRTFGGDDALARRVGALLRIVHGAPCGHSTPGTGRPQLVSHLSG